MGLAAAAMLRETAEDAVVVASMAEELGIFVREMGGGIVMRCERV